LIVQARDYLGTPVFGEEAEFFGQADPGCHGSAPRRQICFRVTGRA
jgi:hypothetical protein